MNKKTIFQDEFSSETWLSTYKDYQDETVDNTFMRIAAAVAQAEKTDELKEYWTSQFYDALTDFKSTCGGRIYSNAGTEWGGTTLFNCYTAPRRKNDIDSLDNIIENISNQAKTLKSEGGWGENFSYIRPRGSFIYGIGVESPGAIKYMELFDKSSDIVTSGSGKTSTNKKAKGKIRKGAMMGVLDCWHPDIIEFVTAKQTAGRLSKFNMSVNCTDEFMEKVIKVQELKAAGASEEEINQVDEWHLKFPVTTHPKYKKEWDGNIAAWEEKGYDVNIVETTTVSKLWDLIMESTYNRAEPGVLFLDRANANNPGYYFEHITETNPCGEITLPPGGVCNLGSINLTQFINTKGTNFNYTKLAKYVSIMVRLLDNINDVSNFPLDEYRKTAQEKRRVGLGVLGWGSSLLMLKVRFGSEEAEKLREKVLQTIYRTAYISSIDLAEEKGMFKHCDPIKHSEGEFVKRLNLPKEYIDKLRKVGIRNSTLGAIAPNGNTSIFANVVSGGLEPVFMPEYIRTVIVSVAPPEIADVTPKWYEGEFHETKMFKFAKEGDEQILKGTAPDGTVYKIDSNRGLTKEVLCEDYGVRYLKSKNEWDPKADWAVTTTELSATEHLRDLQGFAKYIDQSCSKTINLPHEYSFEDFKDIYVEAYKTGYIKGVTTYRSGTMTTVLSAKEDESTTDEEIILDDVELPDSSPGVVKTIRAEGKKWYLTIVYHETTDRPFAIFVQTNNPEKSVITNNAIELLIDLAKTKKIPSHHIDEVLSKINSDNNASKITRVISFLLRHGVLIKNIVQTLDAVDDIYVGSFIFQIKKFLSSYIKDGEKADGVVCSECGGSNVVFAEGCFKCNDCGSSKCG